VNNSSSVTNSFFQYAHSPIVFDAFKRSFDAFKRDFDAFKLSFYTFKLSFDAASNRAFEAMPYDHLQECS